MSVFKKVSFSCDLSALPLVFPRCRYSEITVAECVSLRNVSPQKRRERCWRQEFFFFQKGVTLSHMLIVCFLCLCVRMREREGESERNGGWCAGWFRECSMTCCRLERGPSRGDSDARPGPAPALSLSLALSLPL